MEWSKRLEQYPRSVIWGVAVGLALVGAALIYNATAKTVAVYLGGERRIVRTHASSVESLVRQIGIEPTESDRFDPGLDQDIQNDAEIRIALAETVRIEVDDEVVNLETAELVPANILAEVGIRLFPGDRVLVDGLPIRTTAELDDLPEDIQVRRGFPIHINLDGKTVSIRSAAPTVGAALAENEIILREGDQISPELRTPLNGSARVTLKRSQPLTFVVDGVEMSRRAVGPTVADALESAGVALVGLDYAVPGTAKPLPVDGRIQVVRVREHVQVELEPLSFETLYEPDPSIEIDQRSVVDTGAYGIIARWTRARQENGEEVGRHLVTSAQVVEPRPRIVGYGTKIVVRTLNTSNGPIQYWRAVEMYATGYSPCRSAADRCYYHTSSGELVQEGVVAFVRRWYLQMKGWPIYVEGYGTATVEDVGGGIPGRYWIDLAYSDDNYESWNRWVTVYFLTPVPPVDAIPYILR
jgi:uncharacterized protein YabE (DUF348 family)